jgi:hypothetical protein
MVVAARTVNSSWAARQAVERYRRPESRLEALERRIIVLEGLVCDLHAQLAER